MIKTIPSMWRSPLLAVLLLAGLAFIPQNAAAIGEDCSNGQNCSTGCCVNNGTTCGTCGGSCDEANNCPADSCGCPAASDCRRTATGCSSDGTFNCILKVCQPATNGSFPSKSACDASNCATGGGGGDGDKAVRVSAIDSISGKKIRGEATLTIDPDDNSEGDLQTSAGIATFHVVGGSNNIYTVEGTASSEFYPESATSNEFKVISSGKNITLLFDHADTSCDGNLDCRIAWFDVCAQGKTAECDKLKHKVCCLSGTCVKETAECYTDEPPEKPTCGVCATLGADNECHDQDSRCVSQPGGHCIGGECQYDPPRKCSDDCGSTCDTTTCPTGTSCGCTHSDCTPGTGTLNCAKPEVTAETVTGNVGSPFTFKITATNNPTSYKITPLPPLNLPLPDGLTLSGPNISGTPTKVTEPRNVLMTATNKFGSGSAVLNITILNALLPEIISPDKVQGIETFPFLYQIMARNCSFPLVCTYKTHLQSENLPPGLVDGADPRQIVGSPAPGSHRTDPYPVTLSVTNSGGTTTKQLSIQIDSLSPPTDLGGTTSSNKDGTFTWKRPDPVILTVNHYGCVNGACTEVADGVYTTPNCDGVSCVITPPTKYYRCSSDSSNACIQDNTVSTFPNDPGCGPGCGAPVNHHRCSNFMCIQDNNVTTFPNDPGCGPGCGTPVTCPNGACDNGETCTTCPQDCGHCLSTVCDTPEHFRACTPDQAVAAVENPGDNVQACVAYCEANPRATCCSMGAGWCWVYEGPTIQITDRPADWSGACTQQ